jgi:isoleucyl-tRNA synthetase
MDCWLIASLQTLIKTVHVEIGENYKLYNVAPPLVSYLEQITNWYRRNVFLRHYILMTIFSPRQAREKYREH